MPRRHNRTGRSNREAQHVRLYKWMQDSPAWLSLTPVARSIWFELARLYNGSNNGRLALSVRMAAQRCRAAKDTAARAFSHLQERGFIECVTPGGFNLKKRHATEWRLTHVSCNVTGELPSKRFMHWHQEKQNTVPIQTATVPNQGHPNHLKRQSAA
jgi:hypothetical protein